MGEAFKRRAREATQKPPPRWAKLSNRGRAKPPKSHHHDERSFQTEGARSHPKATTTMSEAFKPRAREATQKPPPRWAKLSNRGRAKPRKSHHHDGRSFQTEGARSHPPM